MESNLSALDNVYRKIAKAQEVFRTSAREKERNISCADSCGECCRKFIPDILPLEAEAIALYLLSERPDLLPRLESSEQSCPFMDEDNPQGCCGIYPARPMVCRLFGFSAISGKDGEPEFTLCRHMTALNGITGRKHRGKILLEELFGSLPPLMGHYAMEIASINPAATERNSLLYAVPDALSKIGLGSSLMRDSA